MSYLKRHLCRRLIHNIGWWDIVWCSYPEATFRKTFRVSQETFMYILSFIRNDLHVGFPRKLIKTIIALDVAIFWESQQNFAVIFLRFVNTD